MRQIPLAVFVLSLVIGSLALGGCGTKLIPTPVAFGEAGADPFAGTPESAEGTTSTVFLAMNRAHGTPKAPVRNPPDPYYTNDRSQELHLARATVRMGGEKSTWAELDAASREEKRSWEPTVHVEGIEEFGVLGAAKAVLANLSRRDRHTLSQYVWEQNKLEYGEEVQGFLTAINEAMESSGRQEIYIFVHGFNTKLEQNTKLAASLWHYLGRQGVIVSFDWPSRASMFSYSRDKAAAGASILQFRLLLWLLHARSEAEKIHILAHSAGAPVAVGALTELRLMMSDLDVEQLDAKSKLGQVVLAAPDMDLMVFQNSIYEGFDQLADGVTVYMSSADEALSLSGWIYGFARLGDPMKALSHRNLKNVRDSETIAAVDVAQAVKVHGSVLGHSYFHHNPWVSGDLFMLLRYGARPQERGLYRKPDGAFWLFPKDYEQTGPARARVVYGEEATERLSD